MRPHVLLTALLAGAACIWAAMGIARSPGSTGDKPERGPIVLEQHAAGRSPALGRLPVLRVADASPASPGQPSASEAEPVRKILCDLESAEPEVCARALLRARALGDRSIIPALRNVADLSPEPDQKAAILDTIRFLELPSLEENLAGAAAFRAAAGLPTPPPNPANRWTGRPFVANQ